MDSNKGGSPTALDLNIVFSSLGVFSNSLILNSGGTSRLPGILYVEGPRVKSLPSGLKYSSSHVSHPIPWMKPPSICPLSIRGLRELPQS